MPAGRPQTAKGWWHFKSLLIHNVPRKWFPMLMPLMYLSYSVDERTREEVPRKGDILRYRA